MKKKKESIVGGLSSNYTINDISKKHKVKLSDIQNQLKMGINVEKEHTNNKKIAKEIALDHIFEDPKYYTKLKKIESNESTDASSSGGFDVPLFGSTTKGRKSPLKIGGVESIKKSNAVQNDNFPKWGGSKGVFVKIKEKCKKFPYCNQGDINNLEFFENKELNGVILELSETKKIPVNEIKNLILKKIIKGE